MLVPQTLPFLSDVPGSWVLLWQALRLEAMSATRAKSNSRRKRFIEHILYLSELCQKVPVTARRAKVALYLDAPRNPTRYPALRSALVAFELTTRSVIRLIRGTNISTRVKAFARGDHERPVTT